MDRFTHFRQTLKEIENLSAQEDDEAALILLDRLLSEYPSATQLLIKKGVLIQLLPETSELGELADAQNALETAVVLDPKSVEALLELGHFQSAVLDADLEAEKRFDQAIEHCYEFLEAAYRGKIQSLINRGESVAAQRWIQEVRKIFPDSVEMEQ